MSEEIKKQYANGIVNADEVIKSLIDKFKIDKTSVDIQQLQLMAEYLIYRVDRLQKENEKYKKDYMILQAFYSKDYIRKDTIRDKIKELEEESNGDDYTLINVINILKNLLGE